MLAVTGSTGRVGGRVARALAGQPLRLLVRDPSRAPDLEGAEVVASSYDDPRGLEGVDVLFMVSGAEAVDRVDQHRRMVAAAADAGVRHLVYTSFQGAAPYATFTLGRDHWATEQAVRQAGLTWTFLRDSFYLDDLVRFAGDEGVLRGPAGQGRVAGVAIEDVASVATAVLRDPAVHEGKTYELTGPRALTLAELAEAMTAAGRPARFVDETLEQAHASRQSYGAPDWQVEAWVSTYTAIARGEVAHVSGDVERLTGRTPIAVEQLLRA